LSISFSNASGLSPSANRTSIPNLLNATFIFKDKIVKMVVNGINENINATLSYQDTDISFFKNFPELEWEHGYYIIWGVMIVVVLFMFVYFKMKKWF
jgi:hypothetical protein